MASKLKVQAANYLAALLPDYLVDPDDIEVLSGFWKRIDMYRWEVRCRHYVHKEWTIKIRCWGTLTNFVYLASRHGCEIYYITNGLAEIHAKDQGD